MEALPHHVPPRSPFVSSSDHFRHADGMRSLPIFLALALAPLQAQVPEVRTTAKDRIGLSVTIYQNGLAAVRDTRRVALPQGPSRLAFSDLLPSLRPKSAVLLESELGIQVRERNYEFNLLSPASLLEASLGQTVRIRETSGVAGSYGVLASVPLLNPRLRLDAKPLERIARKPSAFVQPPDPNVAVAFADGVVSASREAILFQSSPSSLKPSPTLVQNLEARVAGESSISLLYTAEDLSWTPCYIATLASDGRSLDLNVLANVTNRSSGTLSQTTLQLVAGEPNIIDDPPPNDPNHSQVDRTEVRAAATVEVVAAPFFKEEKLSEYPLFTLDRPVTLTAHSDKQLHLMSLLDVPVHPELLLCAPEESPDLSPSVFIGSPLFQEPGQHEIETNKTTSRWYRHPPVWVTARIPNTIESHLGRALPGGPLLIQYHDPSGALVMPQGASGPQFGEMPPTPPQEIIQMTLGVAHGFHVKRQGALIKRKQEGGRSKLVRQTKSQKRWNYSVSVTIQSDRSSAADILVREPLPASWRMGRSNQPGHRSSATTWDFPIHVPPQASVTLVYEAVTGVEVVELDNTPQTKTARFLKGSTRS